MKRILGMLVFTVLLSEALGYRDLETGVFLTRDPIGYGDGPNVYCYVHCNPITSFDPWGLNTRLLVQTTGHNNHLFGHVAIAVENYKESKNFFTRKVSYKSDGTYTVYDLSGTRNSDLSGSQYHTKVMTKEQLDKSTDYNAQVEFKTDHAKDQEVTEKLKENKEKNPRYHTTGNNCGDYVKPGVETASGQKYKGKETATRGGVQTTLITPNQTFKEVSDMDGAKIIRDPGTAGDSTSLVASGMFSDDEVTTSTDDRQTTTTEEEQ